MFKVLKHSNCISSSVDTLCIIDRVNITSMQLIKQLIKAEWETSFT